METGVKDPTFTGTDRFAVRRLLGGGAMGLVYEAYDRDRDRLVALKTLRDVDARSIYRLKQEFRSLTDLHHENLVSLYELVGNDDHWFIIMELIDGQPFVSWVREEGFTYPLMDTWPSEDFDTELLPTEEIARADLGPRVCPNLPRLRNSLGQLMRGVVALHDHGKLHRDLKPANVLVTSEGRVVLVDFGLVYETDRAMSEQTRVDKVIGTAAFMAPEQSLGTHTTVAADLYSIGVILYQSLTGRLPFQGTMVQMLTKKQTRVPDAPSTVVDGVPEDLDKLCMSLLSRAPEERPSAREVLALLGIEDTAPRPTLRRSSVEGREAERQQLEDAWRIARHNRLAVVEISGSAGMGKTSLVRSFLNTLRQRQEATVVLGRCFERESVRFNVFDSVMDSLQRRLKNLPTEKRRDLLPNDLDALARLFPALAALLEDTHAVRAGDPGLQRERAFGAVVALFENLARQRPVALFLDDVHWGDTDSAQLLLALLRGLQRRPVLVVLGYRSDNQSVSAFLTRFLHDPLLHRLERSLVTMRELSPPTALRVARELVGEIPNASEVAEWIARESGGTPYLMTTLAQHVKAGTAVSQRGIELLFADRIAALPPPARAFLVAVAIAGRPLSVSLLARAAGVEDPIPLLMRLRAEHLVRTTRGPLGERCELYNSQITHAVQEHMGDQQMARAHLRMADTLEAAGATDAETLMMHRLAGGEVHRAAALARKAAEDAHTRLAFDRSASLFRTALSLGDHDDATRCTLEQRLAQCLAAAGRGEEAAELYLSLASRRPADAVLHRRRAAEQLLTSGHLDQAICHLTDTLGEVGLTWPNNDWTLPLRIRAQRLQIRWMDTTSPSGRSTEQQAQRIDTCYMVALAFMAIEPLRGTYFHNLGLIYSKRYDDASRFLRSLAMEMVVRSNASPDDWRALERQARDLAIQVGTVYGSALITLAEGLHAYLHGRFKTAYRQLRAAQRQLTDHAPGHALEAGLARLFALRALVYTGELKTAAELLPGAIQAVEERGNLLISSSLRGDVSSLVRLARDEVDQVRRDIDSILTQWSQDGLHYQHSYALRSRINLLLYLGRSAEAWQACEETWSRLMASRLHVQPFSHLTLVELRGRAALAAALERKPLRAIVRESARTLTTDSHRFAQGLGHLLQGQVDALERRFEAAEVNLRTALRVLERSELGLHTAATRRRLGEFLRNEEGTTLVAAANGWLENQHVRYPAQLVRTLAPGWG